MIYNFYVKLSNREYLIRADSHSDEFLDSFYTFELETADVFIPLKTKFENELVRDLCAIMGIDPQIELSNVIYRELKKELFEFFYNTTYKEQEQLSALCTDDQERLSRATYDPIFKEWLFNFKGDK